MKKLRVFGLALGVMLSVSAVSVSAAMAYEWQLNGKTPLEPVNVSSTSSKILTMAPKGPEETYSCTIVTKRTLTAGGDGEVTSVTSSGGAKSIPCEITKKNNFCESGVKIEALKLPWATELGTTGGTLHDTIAGSPEWKFTCTLHGENYTNWCAVAPSAVPYYTGSGIEEIAVASPRTVCFEGHLETKGSELLAATEGTLDITPAPAPAWDAAGSVITGTAGVKWEGKIKLTGAYETLECADTAEGTVGSIGSGKLGKVTFSSCTGHLSGTPCEKTSKTYMEALHTPWNSELGRSEEIIDTMTNSGSGVPGLKMSCGAFGIGIVYECTGVIRSIMGNAVSHVEGTFDGREELACNEATTAKVGGTQTITPSLGGELQIN